MAVENKNLISSIIENSREKHDGDEDPFIPLSIRPGAKISELLEILSNLTSKSPSEYAGDGVPEALFLYILSSEEKLELASQQILTVLSEGGVIQKGSALNLLIERGVIEVVK